MLGVVSGWTLLSILLLLGSGVVFTKFEYLQIVIKILGSIYLFYLAYKISFTVTKSGKKVSKPVLAS